jgi:hypothetical protein
VNVLIHVFPMCSHARKGALEVSPGICWVRRRYLRVPTHVQSQACRGDNVQRAVSWFVFRVFVLGYSFVHLGRQEEREPSYCDRVLWKSLPTLISHVECQGVAGHPSIPTSDHKPVSAHFRLYCPPPVTAIEYGHTSQLPRIVFSELRGSQLFAADIHTSDPYIEFYADADGVLVTSSKGVPRTPVKSNTLNPRYTWTALHGKGCRVLG